MATACTQGCKALLTHPALQDPQPRGQDSHTDPGQMGDPRLDTAFYDKGLGGLRVDVLLPQAGLQVTAAGVLWPPDQDAFAATLAAASHHRPVWADLVLP